MLLNRTMILLEAIFFRAIILHCNHLPVQGMKKALPEGESVGEKPQKEEQPICDQFFCSPFKTESINLRIVI